MSQSQGRLPPLLEMRQLHATEFDAFPCHPAGEYRLGTDTRVPHFLEVPSALNTAFVHAWWPCGTAWQCPYHSGTHLPLFSIEDTLPVLGMGSLKGKLSENGH